MRAHRESQRGFTLIELMVVVVILGTLIALVGPNIMRIFWTSNTKSAQAQMSSFSGAIDIYYLDHKRLPANLEVLTEADGANPHPYLKKLPRDPWGNAYEYRLTGKHEYTIRSAGEDLMLDTEDDIVWPDAVDPE